MGHLQRLGPEKGAAPRSGGSSAHHPTRKEQVGQEEQEPQEAPPGRSEVLPRDPRPRSFTEYTAAIVAGVTLAATERSSAPSWGTYRASRRAPGAP